MTLWLLVSTWRIPSAINDGGLSCGCQVLTISSYAKLPVGSGFFGAAIATGFQYVYAAIIGVTSIAGGIFAILLSFIVSRVKKPFSAVSSSGDAE